MGQICERHHEVFCIIEHDRGKQEFGCRSCYEERQAEVFNAFRGVVKTPKPVSELQGKFWWPTEDWSLPADDLCWHVPPSPNADFRCVRERGHPGAHDHRYGVVIKGHSHKSLTGGDNRCDECGCINPLHYDKCSEWLPMNHSCRSGETKAEK